jgi:hypothetical protein
MPRFIWMRTTVTCFIPVLALAACGQSDAEWRGTVRDSAGVTIVSNSGGGVWGPAEAWVVAEDLRIGTAEGDPNYQFGQIAGIDVDEEGRIYVMDQQAREVRVFGVDGRFLHSMGKPGSGPGELSQGAGPVLVGPDGTIAVPDIMNQRINLYSPLGEPTGSTPLAMTDGIPVRWLKASNQDVIQQTMVMAFPGMEVEPRNLVLRRDARGTVLDTLLTLPVGESVNFAGAQPQIRLFSPEAMWAITWDDRLIHGRNDEYRLQLLSPDGSVDRIVVKQGERRPVTAGDQAAFRRELRKAWEQGGLPPQALEMMAQSVSFAAYYPAYMNLLGGPDGTIWVQSVQTPETVEEMGGSFDIQDMGGPTWDVFGEDGRFLGVVRMPNRFAPMLFDRHDAYSLYGILRDDLDVQYVARVRVGPPTRSDTPRT